METLADKKPSLKLDKRTYSTVINAYAKSSEFKKAHNAVAILNRMEPAGVTPDVFTYTAVINACAFSHRKEQSYGIALEILQRMRELSNDISDAAPNSITYKTMLQACTNLFQHDSPKRDEEVERTFEWCKEDGMCCDMVLLQLKRAASQSLLSQLVGGDVANLEVITSEDVPSEWSRNIDRRLIQR
uniref:Pentacotripeptide-repeat region of PRORP domain-containing protein n=1 Tax=Leptocylindrus danicus TaxID=163516 RepID=A0A7S2L1W7_9STRA